MTAPQNSSSHAHPASRSALAGLIMAWAGTSAEAEPLLLQNDRMGTAAPRSAGTVSRSWRLPAASDQTALAAATVIDCGNSGPNTLRAAVESGASIIDMTALGCSTISLTTGAIIVSHDVPSVAFMGPTDHVLKIDANNNGRVLVHNGEGTLTLDHVELTNGRYANGYYGGGCVYAFGSATLQNAAITNCTLTLGNYEADGGAIYVKHDLTLNDSVLSGNIAQGVNGKAHGGGAHVKGKMVMNRSTIRDNSAFSSQNSAKGGGAYVFGVSELYASTVSGNLSEVAGGFLSLSIATVSNSTISGNSASVSRCGLYASSIVLDNSTVVFNTHASADFGAGIFAINSILAHSSIVANNTSTTSGQNVGVGCLSNCPLNGSNNLIMGANGTLPADTIVVDPMLAPLAFNGGPTRTHALLDGSPAIDNGSNVHDFAFDQRGLPRNLDFGPDIGAFESGVDPIFEDGFE